MFNGRTYDYKESADLTKTLFSTLQNQKGTIADEKYVVLDDTTVLYTTNLKIEGEFKSPDMISKTTYINNKPVRTEVWTRIK